MSDGALPLTSDGWAVAMMGDGGMMGEGLMHEHVQRCGPLGSHHAALVQRHDGCSADGLGSHHASAAIMPRAALRPAARSGMMGEGQGPLVLVEARPASPWRCAAAAGLRTTARRWPGVSDGSMSVMARCQRWPDVSDGRETVAGVVPDDWR